MFYCFVFFELELYNLGSWVLELGNLEDSCERLVQGGGASTHTQIYIYIYIYIYTYIYIYIGVPELFDY